MPAQPLFALYAAAISEDAFNASLESLPLSVPLFTANVPLQTSIAEPFSAVIDTAALSPPTVPTVSVPALGQ